VKRIQGVKTVESFDRRLIWRGLDKYSMAPYEGGKQLPYTVCKVVAYGNEVYEAWHDKEPIAFNLPTWQDAQSVIIDHIKACTND
jgi:hypothetical protein